MTFIEYRLKRAAITRQCREQLDALDAAYSAEDRTAAKAHRAQVARDARTATKVERGAALYLAMWDRNPRAFVRGVCSSHLISTPPTERDQMRRACELSGGRYTYSEAGGLWAVTQS